MKWVAARELIPADWDQIHKKANDELDNLPVCKLYPALSVQQSQNGRRYKFRRYASSGEANEKLRILATLGHALPMTALVAESDQTLCFDYIDSVSFPDDLASYQAMGRWLGSLCAKTWDWDSPSAFDAYHALWLKDLEESGFFSRSVIQRARVHYEAMRPTEVAVCINYWDAMPPNFGIQSGEAILLDEKHLRMGLSGISMVKPRLFLPAAEYTALAEGYQTTALDKDLQHDQPYLEIVYRTYALWFYLHGMQIGATTYDVNSRLRRFRASFLSTHNISALDIRRDRFVFFLHFPQQTTRYFWKRVKRWTRRTFQMDS